MHNVFDLKDRIIKMNEDRDANLDVVEEELKKMSLDRKSTHQINKTDFNLDETELELEMAAAPKRIQTAEDDIFDDLEMKNKSFAKKSNNEGR